MRARVFAGLLLIGLGVLFLLRGLDLIPEDVALWPLILIVIGIWLLLGERRWGSPPVASLVLIGIGTVFLLRDLEVLADVEIVWPVVLIAVGAALLLGGFRRPQRRRPNRHAARGRPALETVQDRIPRSGAREARIRIDYGAGRLTVGPGETGDDLLTGSFTGGVDKDVRPHGDRIDVRLGQPSRTGVVTGRTLDWSLHLHPEVTYVLDLHTGASDGRYDLQDLQVSEVSVETGASRTELLLPRRGHTEVRVEAGAAQVQIRVPAGVAARVRTDTGLAQVRVDTSRFPKDGGVYESPGFADAADRADIRIEGGAGTFRVD